MVTSNYEIDLRDISPVALNDALTRYLATLSANIDHVPTITMPSWMVNMLNSHYYNYSLNRNEGRKEARRKRRIINISSKVYNLLIKCDISFLSTISPKEVDRLRQSVELALNRDGNGVEYYPIPKNLNNKIRKFIHDNPLRPGHASLGSGDSFLFI